MPINDKKQDISTKSSSTSISINSTTSPLPNSLVKSLTTHLEARERASRLRTLQTQHQQQHQQQQNLRVSDLTNPILHQSYHHQSPSSTLQLLKNNERSTPQIDFSSNDFLSLSRNPSLRHAFLAETSNLTRTHGLSSTGSRLLDGDSTYASDLEKVIAAFHSNSNDSKYNNNNNNGKKAPVSASQPGSLPTSCCSGLLFNSGYDANVALFTCIPQEGDVLVYDEAIHASVHEGMRGSRVKNDRKHKIAFRHNDVGDLERVLLGLVGGHEEEEEEGIDNYDNNNDDITDKDGEGVRNGKRNVFVAVEAIYSMDGDVANLLEIVELVERLLPMGNGYVIVDEAHATGVLGPKGRGLVCELQLENRVFARLHTFGKALACGGAIVLCSPLVRQYLINYARPLIYTTSMSYPSLAAIKTSYDFLMLGKAEPLVKNLDNLVQALFTRLQDLADKYHSPKSEESLFEGPSECPKSPIFSILTSRPRSLARNCQQGGFMVRAIVPPTVPKGTERVRVCLHAGNKLEEIDSLVRRIEQWLSASLAQKLDTYIIDNGESKSRL